jgi:beta-lactamase class A
MHPSLARSKIFILSLSLSLAAYLLGLATGTIIDSARPNSTGVNEIRQGGYRLISPLLECGPDQVNLITTKSFQKKIQATIDHHQATEGVTHISLYYRDLNNGTWFGVKETELFSPASLLKVPILIAAFKQAEEQPELLATLLEYQGEFEYDRNLDIDASAAASLVVGHSYSIAQLIEKMIIHSDNLSKDMLITYLDKHHPHLIDQVHYDLGLAESLRRSAISANFISVKDYAGLFRILYNSSYLDRDMSEKALDLLSQTGFDAGLKGGLPKSLTVANKFGFREPEAGLIQLHDCGIVYLPGQPYLLCLMTRSPDLEISRQAISRLSTLVYQEVSRQLNGLDNSFSSPSYR